MVNLGELVFSIIAEDKASTTVGAAAAKIGQSAMAIGAGITAVGGAATLLIDRNREMDASFRTTALSMGVPAEAVKELARSLQSVDSPIAEVSATLDILARSGMDNVESMGQTASAFDTLADGIGVNADTLTDAMVPAFAALNIELEDAPQYVDGLATTFRTANVDLDDFTRMMERVGPELGEMGLGLQDVEAILMALAKKGITGRTAIRELNEAIDESGGSSAALYRSLGITNTELGTYNTKLANSAGAAQEFADAQNSAFGTVDKLGFELDKLGQYAGDMLAPFEGVATACLAIGPAMTIAGSAASLLDNEMMVKLFPSLGKVVTGITGAGGLVPALGSLTTSVGLTSAGLTTFATAAAAIAVPLVALVGTCALLGPAVDAAADAWVKFLGGTYDTTAALEGVEEQYDITTGAVVRYADEQTEAAIIAADASLKYDSFGTVIEESAESIAVAEQAYDEFGNAIEGTTGTIQTAVPIYDEFGTCIGEMAPDIRDADEAASDAAVSFDEWGNV
ncbi:MAG: phage tail tape measure protein, partial [Bacilli bacterium]